MFSPRILAAIALGLTNICAPAHAAALLVEVRDPAGQAIPDAAVYAVPKVAPPKRARRGASIEQVNRQFSPLMTVIQTGAAINFPNKDDVRHHVYSFSQTKPFEIKLYVGTPAEPVVFEKSGEVVLGCNIHDQMRAFIYVVDTPFYAKTDSTGKASLESLPGGEYELRVWHYAQATSQTGKQVSLRADESAKASFGIALRSRPGPK